jgi:hypothetical protein
VKDGSGFVQSTYEIKFSTKSRTLDYERAFQIGLPDTLALTAKVYPLLKTLLDAVHASDNHSLLIKREVMDDAEVKQ